MADSNNGGEKSKIEIIKEALYSRNTDGIFAKKRHILKEKVDTSQVPSAWKEEPSSQKPFEIPYQKIFLGALIFFVLAIGFAAIRFFGGSNTVSGGNIDILISGPVSVAGGEALPLTIQVKNNNSVDLKIVDLHIDYPDGTKDPTDLSKDFKRYVEGLGDINAGQAVTRLIKAVLFGSENTEQTIKVSVEYRVSGSNAIFSKEKDFTVLISSSPVTLIVNGPDQVNANQPTDFSVNVKSNSLSTIKNVILAVNYPFGFNLISANPKPVLPDGSVFSLGDLAPGAEISLRISGLFQGADGEEKVLKFAVGSPASANSKTIGTTFASFTKNISLTKSFIGIAPLINQSSDSEVSVHALSKIISDISWQNNLPENVYNMSIQIKFIGQILDKSSVNVNNGFYNSSQNTIIFDKSNVPDFGTVSPGASGDVSFDFSTIDPSTVSASAFSNGKIELDISVLGTRTGGNAPEVLYTGSRIVKISSALSLLSKGFRTVGPFENSGPFPPQADQETTYTITWTATNSFNSVNNAKVSAALPQGVKWTGYTSPDTENITYDPSRNEVVWNIGDMRSYTGAVYPAREASFQVAITPSISQVGQNVDLLNEATITGQDASSGDSIGETKSTITTNITSDPAYVEGIGKVSQ